jgi:hypothetical protein
MSKLVTLDGGEIFAVPLFLADVPVTKSFATSSFSDRGNEFAFIRVIKDMLGGGFLCEVFRITGSLATEVETIVTAPRLFPPVAVSGLGILKKRWKKIGEQKGYDREQHSGYSQIRLVIGDPLKPRLWQNGQETPISLAESKTYEQWQVWMPNQIEKRIIDALQTSGGE